MNEIDYERLADAIARKLNTLPSANNVIWSVEQCAEYLGIGKRHFVDRVSKTWGFPSAIKLPTEKGSHGRDRWHAVEIQEWASLQKKRSKNIN